jgi:hypothetical protein
VDRLGMYVRVEAAEQLDGLVVRFGRERILILSNVCTDALHAQAQLKRRCQCVRQCMRFQDLYERVCALCDCYFCRSPKNELSIFCGSVYVMRLCAYVCACLHVDSLHASNKHIQQGYRKEGLRMSLPPSTHLRKED